MKIAVIAANGKAGNLILKEALKRDVECLAIVRDKSKMKEETAVLEKSLFDLAYDDVKDCDVVVDAFGAWTAQTLDQHESSLKHLSDILKNRPNRLLVVGGAGSLYVDKERKTRVMDAPDFPEAFKPLAAAMAKGLDLLRRQKDVQWTYLSPACDFQYEGKKIGRYLVGGEELTLNSQGESALSYGDYALAMIDEALKGKNIQKRISIVSE